VALARATEVAAVLAIRNHAEAVRVACANARAGLVQQNQAAEIRLRAERKAGQLLNEEKRPVKRQADDHENSSHDGTSFHT